MSRLDSPVALTALLLFSASAAAQTPPHKYAAAGIADDRLVEAFVADLRRAVARDDRQGVAAMVRYPIVVWAGGLRIPAANAKTLVARYDVVFTAALKNVVATAPLTAMRDGVAIGSRLLLIAPDERQELKIAEIRIPMDAAAEETPSPGSRTRGTATRPRRLTFSFSRGSATGQALGSIAPSGKDTYLAWAAAGSLLEARINGVQGLVVVLRVFDAATGKPVDARADLGLRLWRGRVPSQGDYRIEVTHAGTTSATLAYTLVVTRR